MQTIRQHIYRLPKKIYIIALKNIIQQKGETRLDVLAENTAEAINSGFTWNSTKQGQEYWSNLYDNLKEHEIKLRKAKL